MSTASRIPTSTSRVNIKRRTLEGILTLRYRSLQRTLMCIRAYMGGAGYLGVSPLLFRLSERTDDICAGIQSIKIIQDSLASTNTGVTLINGEVYSEVALDAIITSYMDKATAAKVLAENAEVALTECALCSLGKYI